MTWRPDSSSLDNTTGDTLVSAQMPTTVSALLQFGSLPDCDTVMLVFR
jgi:hypothetical protein